MGVRICRYCGEIINSSNKKAKYCSDKCRVYAYRERKRGVPSKPMQLDASEIEAAQERRCSSRITENDIVQAVVTIRGCCSTLSAGALSGPEDMRDACRYVSRGITGIMEKVGL